MFFPSTHPNSRKPSEKLAANSGLNGPALRTPILYLFPACCARAASGHVATAQLSAAINSRRLIGFSSGRAVIFDPTNPGLPLAHFRLASKADVPPLRFYEYTP